MPVVTAGKRTLGQHCLELALKNPYLEENWEKRFRRVFSHNTAFQINKAACSCDRASPLQHTKPDDGDSCITIALFKCREHAARMRI